MRKSHSSILQTGKGRGKLGDMRCLKACADGQVPVSLFPSQAHMVKFHLAVLLRTSSLSNGFSGPWQTRLRWSHYSLSVGSRAARGQTSFTHLREWLREEESDKTLRDVSHESCDSRLCPRSSGPGPRAASPLRGGWGPGVIIASVNPLCVPKVGASESCGRREWGLTCPPWKLLCVSG